MIAHDSTLRAVAEARPLSLSDLTRTKGFGAKKADQYGHVLIAEIRAFVGGKGGGPGA